ncbi:5-carboxy-2-oxohept-3-enedioate decarboxylase HpaG1 subunit [Oceanospirillum multiglobuliferum]|nr:fumarylacetoacetate hydrolase family protein [Oceanospirillum multiglobuliferum]SKA04749.1 5-carboxy-2-oxohept-3-enedioate decarboxylase HpaG1 subunit [Oceanospirillum multiglobuliferum]
MRHSRILKDGVATQVAIDPSQQQEMTSQQWLPATTGTVFGIALNDKALCASMEQAFNEKPHVNPPKTPVLHIKTANTHIGYGAAIPAPANGEAIYAGPSIGIVMGQKATRVSEADAMSYVAGFTIVNEVTLAENSFYRPAVKAKCRDGFCPIGPWVVDQAEVATPEALAIRTYINGELSHSTNTDQLVYGLPQIVSYLSSFMTLEAGDLIIAGTPIRTAQLALKAGDTVAIEIDGLGRLENPVVNEAELG